MVGLTLSNAMLGPIRRGKVGGIILFGRTSRPQKPSGR